MIRNTPHSKNPSTQDDFAAVHVLRLDYTNTSAQIIDSDGHVVAIYSGIGGRDAAARRIALDGWHLSPTGTDSGWTYTDPPDGREHTVYHQEAACLPQSHPTPDDLHR